MILLAKKRKPRGQDAFREHQLAALESTVNRTNDLLRVIPAGAEFDDLRMATGQMAEVMMTELINMKK